MDNRLEKKRSAPLSDNQLGFRTERMILKKKIGNRTAWFRRFVEISIIYYWLEIGNRLQVVFGRWLYKLNVSRQTDYDVAVPTVFFFFFFIDLSAVIIV